MEQGIYQQYCFNVPTVDVHGTVYNDMYARIKAMDFDFQTQTGTLLMHIGDSPNPKAIIAYGLHFSVTPQQSVDRQFIVELVLSQLTGSTLVND